MAYPLGSYSAMLRGLRSKGFEFAPVRRYFESSHEGPIAYVRHDVDRLAARAVAMAEAEATEGLASTYYFRCDAHGRFPDAAIRRVAALGHEAGFHYECLTRSDGELATAIEQFEKELEALRLVTEVRTITAHGKPLSKWSNMDFTRALDMERSGLLGDGAFSVDFDDILYVTDTGGKYGSPHNVRDRVPGRNWELPSSPDQLAQRLDPRQHPRVLLNSHPERWPDGLVGLAAAAATDMAVNAAKVTLGWVRGARAGR